MDRILLSLLLGVVGGVAGAVGVDLVRGAPAESPESSAAAPTRDADLLARLDRIEAALQAPPVLEAAPAEPPPLATVHAAETLRRIDERIAAMEKRMSEGFRPQGPSEEEAQARRPARRRVALAEISGEVGLTRAEEGELRRIYEETYEKALALLAQPDGDPAEIRREVEEMAKTDPGREALGLKYLPKFIGKIGEFVTLDGERRNRIRTAVGADKASKLEGYDLVEANPLGIGTRVGMEVRNR
jgi:hypothetical protein